MHKKFNTYMNLLYQIFNKTSLCSKPKINKKLKYKSGYAFITSSN